MKKTLALLLVLVSLFTLFAGCSSNKDTADAPKTDAADTAAEGGDAAADAEEADAGEADAGEADAEEEAGPDVPELKGPGNVTLTRLGYNVAFDPNEDPIAGLIAETTGYDVEYFVLPAENADEKLAMEVSGGANYDVLCLTYPQFQTLMSQGALMPLNDLLEVYGQDILNEVPEESWKSISDTDGTIYAVPYKYPFPQDVNSFMSCRLDLMREAGITELPTTIDEFYDCLVTLKEYYGDEYIIFSGPTRETASTAIQWVFPLSIASAFGIYDDWMVNEDGEVYYMTEAEGFQDMVDFLAKCYDEGLLDTDWAVNTGNTVIEKYSGGKAIIAMSGRDSAQVCSPVLIETLGLDWDDIGYIGPLVGSDGTCVYQEMNANSQVSAILRTSENAADVVNWWNLKLQNQLFLNFGIEGTHYTIDENGELDPINPIFADERGNSYYYLDCTNEETFAHDWPSRVRKSQGQYEAFKAVSLYCRDNRPEIYVKDVFASMPAGESYSRYNVSLFNNSMDYILQVMSGAKTIDDLPEFQSDWANNGGEEVREELQAWYDGYYK